MPTTRTTARPTARHRHPLPRRALAAATGLAAGLGLLAAPTPTAAAPDRERFDTRVLAKVQSPGFPAYVHAHRNGRVYAGTYTNPAGDQQRSIVREWSREGTLLRSWRVRNQDLDEPHGVQVANQTRRGELVLLEKSTASVRLLDPRTGKQRRIATLRDLPTCPDPTTPQPGCSPNVVDNPAIPNFATWGPRGALFISDYGQAVIWRIPPRGGRPHVWFASPKLDGTQFGTTDLDYLPGRREMLIAQQSTAIDASAPTNGALYRLKVRRNGSPGRLSTLWESGPTDLPDGFGVGRSGKIYVSNAGPPNQLVVLSPEGEELRRFPEVPGSGDNGSEIPFDTPSSATFAGRSVLVANQAYSGESDHHAILDVHVGERGRKPYLPRGAWFR